MIRILTLTVTVAALSLASCAGMKKKEECTSCCAAPVKEKACCKAAHAKGQKCAVCEAPAKKKH